MHKGLGDQHSIEGIPDGTCQASGAFRVSHGDWQFLEVLVRDAGANVGSQGVSLR